MSFLDEFKCGYQLTSELVEGKFERFKLEVDVAKSGEYGGGASYSSGKLIFMGWDVLFIAWIKVLAFTIACFTLHSSI